MNRIIAVAGCLLLTSAPAIAESRSYELDASHTSIRATWDHQGFSMMSLELTRYDATISIDLDNPENNTLAITFNLVDGIWAGADQAGFHSHLASADLFNVDVFPTATFVASSFETEDGESGVMRGDLTLLGETLPVSLFVELRKAADVEGGHKIGVTANTTITRSDWGMDYAVPIISDWIGITIEAELFAADD